MKIEDEALQVNEQSVTMEYIVKTLVQDSRGAFLNGPMPTKTMQEIIQKVVEAKQAIEGVKQSFEDFVNRVQL